MSAAPSHPPLYRTLVREALSTAWHHPRLWLLGFFAALLHTGGIYDVLLRSFNALGGTAAMRLTDASFTNGLLSWALQPMAQIGQAAGVLGVIGRIQGLALALVLIAIAAGASVIAQGALTYGLGIRLRGQVPPLATSLGVGARFFWKVAALNAVTLGLLWFFRTLVLIPFGTPLEETTAWTIIGSFLTLALYVVAVIGVTATHMLALSSLVLQKYSLAESLVRGFVQARRSWLVVLELGAVFFLLGMAMFFGLGALYVIAGVPLLILTLSAALLNSGWLATVLNAVFFGGAFAAFLILGSFATTVQYSAWQGLAIRIAQGSALAKIHRWFFLHKKK